MSRMLLPPVGFWSYARRDDELAEDTLSQLRELVKREIQLSFGRDDVLLFQDTATIPHGAAWERETLDALKRSTFFIPIITPNFIQSAWCAREVAIFLDREQELLRQYPDLPERSRIFPIDYRRIRDAIAIDPNILAALRKRQWCEFQELRDEDIRTKAVKAKVHDLAETICDLLMVEVEAPPTPQELARREAERTEAHRREQQAKRKSAAEARKREQQKKEEEKEEEKRDAERAAAEARMRDEEAERHLELERARYREEQVKRRAATREAAEAVQRRLGEEEGERNRRNSGEHQSAETGELAAAGAETLKNSDQQPAIVEEPSRRDEWEEETSSSARNVIVPVLVIAALSVFIATTFALLNASPSRPVDPIVENAGTPVDNTLAPGAALRPLQWMSGHWSRRRDCSERITIDPSEDQQRLVIQDGGDPFERRIVSILDDFSVETEQGIFRFQEDGSIRTTDPRLGNVQLIYCPY